MGSPAPAAATRTYDTCPLPTVADKLLFILTYLKQNPIQEVQGQLFGMSQSNANKWIHLLHPVLNQALGGPRTPSGPYGRRVGHDADAASRPKPPAPSPLFFMMGPNDPSSVQKTLRISKSMTVARRNATRSKTSS